MSDSEEKVLEPPTICPLLSIATAKEDEWNDCEREKCYFYHRPTKVCGFMLLAIATMKIEARFGEADLMKILKKP